MGNLVPISVGLCQFIFKVQMRERERESENLGKLELTKMIAVSPFYQNKMV